MISLAARTISRFIPRVEAAKIGPIGIDLALEELHAVQLHATCASAPTLRARASIPFGCPRSEILRNPLRFRSLVKKALGNSDFSGRKAVIALPSGMFRTMSINYRSTSKNGDDSAAVLDVMRDRLEGDLSDFVLDYLPVKNRSKGEECLALVAVSERQSVVDFLELARKARLDVQALEIGPVAISRLVGALSLQTGSQNSLVINSGRRASYLTLMSGTDLLFDQEVAFGENALITRVASSLDMSEKMARDLVLRTGVKSNAHTGKVQSTIEESGLVATMSEILKPQFMQIVEEIKRVCLYAAAETRGGAVRQVYLLGSIARWPGSDDLLSSLTGTKVDKIPDPLALLSSIDDKPVDGDVSAPELAVATGAALRGMQVNG